MKRTLLMLLSIALVITLFAACGTSNNTGNTTNGTNNTTNGDDAAASGGISTGVGIVTGVKSSTAATAEKDGNAQADSLVAVVTLDSAGKIVKCSIDAAQTKVAFSKEGVITADKTAEIKTKNEKGEAYGMKKASAIGKEWNEQAAAFCDWAVGKTVDEIKGLKTKKVDDNHPEVPDVAELTSSVTVTVGDFIKAIEKAAANAKGASVSGDFKTGLGVVTGIGSSKDATAEADGTGQVDSTVAAVTVDSTGKIVACTIDSAQTRIKFNASGELTTNLNDPVSSKLELGDAYGMKKNSGIDKEWFEQITAFSEWMIGKTIDEVKGLKTKQVDDSHPAVPDVAELTSSVTISVGDYIAAVEKAVANAK